MKHLLKILLFHLLLFASFQVNAANRYWVASSTGNWNSTANWSTSSGGLGGASVPGVSDAAIFNSNGPGNCVINTAVAVTTFNITNTYTGIVTQGANTVTISGAGTFAAGVFTGGSANITIAGIFTLSGTAFTSTSGRLELNSHAAFTGGTFIHNNGSVRFNGTGTGSPTLSGISPSFYIVEFVGLGKAYTISSSGNVSIAHALNISGTAYCNINTGTIDVAGDINITNTATGGGGTATVNLNGNGTQNFNGAISGGAGVLPQLTINNTSGAINMTGFPGVANSFNYIAGTINAGSSTFCFTRGTTGSYSINGTLTLNNISFIANAALTLTVSNTISAAGDLNVGGTANVIINTGTINVSGNISLTNTSNAGGGTGIIQINGSGDQYITSTGINGQNRLPDVIINKPSGILTLPSLITVIGDWTYINGNLDAITNNSTIVFTNTLAISGTHSLNNVILEATANRTFTISSGTVLTITGTLTTTGSANIILNTAASIGTTAVQAQGDIIINNTGTGGGGTAGISVNGTGVQAFTSTSAAGQGRLPFITIQKVSGTLILSGIISESRNWTYTTGIVDAVTNASTVVFGGNNLTITSSGMSFYNTTFTSNTSTLANGLTVNGNLTISGTGILAPVSNTIHLSGDWTNRSTTGFTESTSTVNFMGSTLQTITCPGGENFANAITNNSGTGVQLLNNISIATSLNMTKGNIDLNGNTMTLGISAANQGTLTYTIGTIINTGSFVRWIKATTIAAGSAAGLFPMGTSTNNRSFYVSAPATAPTTGGTITVSYNDASSNSAVTFPDGIPVVLVRKDLNWEVSTGNGLAGGIYNLQTQGTGYGTIGSVADLRLTLANSVVATPGTNAGTTANPQVNRTLLSIANLNNTFYIGSVSNINSPLPVRLVSFTASIINNQVELNWKTEEESGNDHFTIQRSVNSQNWENITVTKGAGNSNTISHYKEIDKTPLNGLSYYRLMQTDIDGKSSYSEIRSILISGKPLVIDVYPNPAIHFVVVKSSGTEPMNVAVFGSNGERINSPGKQSENKITLDISGLAPGIYYVRIKQGTFSTIKRVSIIH